MTDLLQRRVNALEIALVVLTVLLTAVAVTGWVEAATEARQLDRTCRVAAAGLSANAAPQFRSTLPWCPIQEEAR